MSYDLYLEMDAGGPEPVTVASLGNMTGNVAPMWRLAGADLAAFDGKLAGDCVPILRTAIAKMEDDPSPFRALDPPNGWGDYASCLGYLREVLAGCAAAPKATVKVSA